MNLGSHQNNEMDRLPNTVKSIHSLCSLPNIFTGEIIKNNAYNSLNAYPTCFSAWSAGQPWTCLMRFSLKCDARVGVKEQEAGRVEELEGVEVVVGALLLLLLGGAWLGPGDGLL